MTRSFPDEAPGRLVAAVRAPTRWSSSAAERAGGHGSNYGLTTRRRRSPSTPEGPIWGMMTHSRREGGTALVGIVTGHSPLADRLRRLLSQVLSWREMTGVGMQINLIQDASVAAAPSGFAATIRAAADVLQQTFRDNVTLNIRFGWGTYNNSVDPALTGSSGSEGGPTAGDAVSYSILRSWLIADASSEADITATGSLPSSNFSLPNNQDSFFVASAQEKALGHFAGSSGTIDGAVGFGTSSTSSFW